MNVINGRSQDFALQPFKYKCVRIDLNHQEQLVRPIFALRTMFESLMVSIYTVICWHRPSATQCLQNKTKDTNTNYIISKKDDTDYILRPQKAWLEDKSISLLSFFNVLMHQNGVASIYTLVTSSSD